MTATRPRTTPLSAIERLTDDEWRRLPQWLARRYEVRLQRAYTENHARPSLHRSGWSRLDGTNPRRRGTNPRATGTNPRAQLMTAQSWLKARETELADCPVCSNGWLLDDAGTAVGRCPEHVWLPQRQL